MKINVNNLSKEFKKVKVLDDINYEFNSGKIYGIYGRNGSGKSVFLKLLCGFYVPTSGNILYDDVDFNKDKKFPNRVRALIESPSFFNDLSGFDNLKLISRIQNTIGDKEINEALDIVKLDEKKKKYRDYSLGMKQKLGIAQAIMEDSDVIILDEPFNGIERSSVKKIIEFLKLKKKEGKIIIISSHIKEDLATIADEFLWFDNGNMKRIKKLDEAEL